MSLPLATHLSVSLCLSLSLCCSVLLCVALCRSVLLCAALCCCPSVSPRAPTSSSSTGSGSPTGVAMFPGQAGGQTEATWPGLIMCDADRDVRMVPASRAMRPLFLRRALIDGPVGSYGVIGLVGSSVCAGSATAGAAPRPRSAPLAPIVKPQRRWFRVRVPLKTPLRTWSKAHGRWEWKRLVGPEAFGRLVQHVRVADGGGVRERGRTGPRSVARAAVVAVACGP